MFNAKTLAWFLKFHRWLALLLSPVFFAVLISGSILAFKPIVEAGAQARLDVGVLAATLDKVDPQGKASSLSVAADGKSFELRSRRAGTIGRFEMGSGAQLPASGFNIFDTALSLHKNLMLGAGWLVELATYAMVVLIVSGLLLGWPKLRNNLSGWHKGLGWIGLPLVVVTPLTGLLMVLHLGMPRLPAYEAAERALPIAQTLAIAARQTDLSGVTQARTFRRGAVMISAKTDTGTVTHIVSGTGQLVTMTQGPGWVRMLHEGTWAGAFSGVVNFLSASVLMGLLGTGMWAWVRRQRQAKRREQASADPAQTTLVAFASQTGTAAKLAEATAQALRKAGESVVLASLAALQPAELVGFRRTLLIASTTGEGELPDPAQGFIRKLQATPVRGSRFSLLALGDSRYKQFCGGGLKLRSALLAQGAEEFLPTETADGDAFNHWQKWLSKLGQTLGLQEIDSTVPAMAQQLKLELVSRTRLDNPQVSDVCPAWQLRLRVLDAGVAFRPGDLLQIRPNTQAMPRSYSIGSSSLTGTSFIELTVGLHTYTDADGKQASGLASGYLCQELAIGERFEAQLRRHDGFNPPKDVTRPLILIATGAGIAPFPGFLEERKGKLGAGPVWLFFGNRKSQGDFYHRNYFEACRQLRILSRIDTAFSRDEDDHAYIQQRLLEQEGELLRWMNDCNAIIYVCGGAETVGKGVDLALRKILIGQGLPAEETLARWKAEGRLRQDLFSC
ncbi:PepSY domain-containing protein [Uliginosibacterium gangwonense]|uniref:PepSY domain-containing protein n=1 Tax=Uliginosibacterium gangwonense TaxID=392736 RepID=UPI00146E493C|nr:PepSY domain-containing protein [Uliginosibacterium gangwonense]